MSIQPRTLSIVCAFCLQFCTVLTFGAAEAPLALDVWPGMPPGETSQVGPEKVEHHPGAAGKSVEIITNVSKPTLTVYRAPVEKDTGAAVVICPGGAYRVLAWDLEGEEVARWLNSIGVTGIILKYRVPERAGQPRYLPPLQDAQRAISLVRTKAVEWHVDPHRIGILGFSAGGNLCGFACTHFDEPSYEPVDAADKAPCRPDFGVLIYPAWLNQEGTAELIPELHVTKNTPRCFFAHASDDPISVLSTVAMYTALKKAGVPSAMHIYASGGHGFGLRPTTQPCSTWPQRCEEWMRSQGLLQPSRSHDGPGSGGQRSGSAGASPSRRSGVD